MKKFTAISLAFLMFAASSKDVVIWAGFKLNQDFIAKVLCINRDKPKMHCNGKCFLAKKLAESQEKNAAKAPIPQPDEHKQFLYLHPQLKALSGEGITSFQKSGFAEATFFHQLVLSDIFQPPKV